MKTLMLLLWIFVVPTHTIVLQPSLNASIPYNVSAESDLFGELRPDWSAFNNEEELRNEEEVTVQETDRLIDTVHSKRDGENNMTKIQMERETESDVRKKQEETQRQKLYEHDMSDVITNKPTSIQELPATTEYTTPASKPILYSPTESVHKQAISQPSFPSGTTSESTYVITSTALLPKTTTATTKHHILTLTAEVIETRLLSNESVTGNDLNVKLYAMNNSKLHLLEEVSVDTTAAAARAGPTATAPPGTLMAKLKNKASRAKPKGNSTVKTKTKKLPKRDRGKEKKTNALKKAKKAGKGKKLKPTASYFPYFKDHYCPPYCSCYGRVVQCSDKDLEKIPFGIPYNSRYILLMNNRIDSIQPNLLSLYDSMEFLVLSNNNLTDATVKGAFKGIQSLKRLYMERNLLRSVPIDLPASLEELRLDGNQVSAISEAAMARCPNLLILSLSNNSLGNETSKIPPGVLLPMGNLRTLTLSHNRLTSVPLQLPLNLRELYLRGNRIHRLQGDMFWGKSELQVLDLSANRLTDKGLGKVSLFNVTRLESLNLEGNLLKQIPRHLPRTIKTLNLEGNLISSIGKDAFITMPQLEHLGLARNKITKVAVGAFRVLPLLHQLDVSHNSLRHVPRQLPLWMHSAAFTHNKIRTVPRDAFCWDRVDGSPLSRLVRVQLEHNMIDLGHLDMLAFRCLRGFQVVQFY